MEDLYIDSCPNCWGTGITVNGQECRECDGEGNAATLVAIDCDCEFYGVADPDCTSHRSPSGFAPYRR